ncbi:hypothetical protein L7F22_030860 [Adiantum nelumboides]|nr:hypothetical protein [Adiantum nelumboides]
MQQVCAACQLGKQAKVSFPQERHVSKNVLKVIHSDVWGLAKKTSMGGCRFYVTFIDDCSHKVWIYFMKQKSEVFTYFQNFKSMIKKQTGNFVQCLRLDGGGEYFSNKFSNFLKKHGIQRQFSCRYTPQQNGVAECKNRHITEVARALMSEKNIPPCYWAEAASTTVYTMNMTPTAAVHDMTPEEKFTEKKPNVSHFKVFGCIAYVPPNAVYTTVQEKKLLLKLAQPPNFKGEGVNVEQDAEVWLEAMDDYFEAAGIHPQNQTMLAMFRLTGDAKIWWKTHCRDFDIIGASQTWEQIKDALTARYLPPAHRAIKMNEFFSLRQMSSTLEEYYSKFVTLRRYASKMTLQQQVARFSQGLIEPLNNRLEALRPTNLQDALLRAKPLALEIQRLSKVEGTI